MQERFSNPFVLGFLLGGLAICALYVLTVKPQIEGLIKSTIETEMDLAREHADERFDALSAQVRAK